MFMYNPKAQSTWKRMGGMPGSDVADPLPSPVANPTPDQVVTDPTPVVRPVPGTISLPGTGTGPQSDYAASQSGWSGGIPQLGEYGGGIDRGGNTLQMHLQRLPQEMTYSPAWLKMMNQRVDSTRLASNDQLAEATARSRTGAMDAAALRGGLSAGSAARMSRDAQRQSVLGQQGTARTAADQRLQAGLEDERRRMQMQQFNIGERRAADEFNIGNNLEELRNRERRKEGIYSEQMKGYAAGQTADAMLANKNPGLLGQVGGIVRKVPIVGGPVADILGG